MLEMCWGLVGLSLHPSPARANVQLSLLGYCCWVEEGRFVQELLAPPVAPHTAGPAEQRWAKEVPLPLASLLGGLPGTWRVLTWGLSFCVPDSMVQIHICMVLLKHPLPAMKYSCPSPKGLQRSKSVSLPCPLPWHASNLCVREGGCGLCCEVKPDPGSPSLSLRK